MSKGVCIWFTGLSAAGKSTTAQALKEELERRGRVVTLLDGDEVRTFLSNGLGFSRADRDLNILRIAFVAKEIVKHGGIVICAAISPYRDTRELARGIIGNENFVEVYMSASLEVCESRDPKGLYAKARSGQIRHFTGIDDPYEPPTNPEVEFTATMTLAYNVELLAKYVDEAVDGLKDARKPTAQVIGRFQPPHRSHLALVREALKMEGQVCICVREPLLNENNPFTYAEVEERWYTLLGEAGLLDRVTIRRLPNITNVVYGRDVGYKITKVELGPELEAVSATKIRKEIFEDMGAQHRAQRDAEIVQILESKNSEAPTSTGSVDEDGLTKYGKIVQPEPLKLEPGGVIKRSHMEGDIEVIDEFEMHEASIVSAEYADFPFADQKSKPDSG